MKTGTCYFPSYGAAMRYYRPYVGNSDYSLCTTKGGELIQRRDNTQRARSLVDQKLNSAEIHIGKPALKAGERLTIEDNRYHIISP